MFSGASNTEGYLFSSDYWSSKVTSVLGIPEVKLHAGYTDGHVENFSSSDTFTMRVIIRPETGEPYPEHIEPGKFFLPRDALH